MDARETICGSVCARDPQIVFLDPTTASRLRRRMSGAKRTSGLGHQARNVGVVGFGALRLSKSGESADAPLFQVSDDNEFISYVDGTDQFIMVDVEGKMVVIDVGAHANKFDEFLPKAQKVLDTVEYW